MNARILPFAVLTVFTILAFPVVSGAKGKHRVLVQAQGSSPSERLAPYIEHVDQLLALERPPKLADLLDAAPGKIAVLKESFSGQRAEAEGVDKARLYAAIGTCDAIIAALDERQKTLGQVQASAAVKNNSALGR